MRKLYLVRHGFTVDNEEYKYSGFHDCDLNELGKKQALEACRFLTSKNIDRVFVSGLRRTGQTVQHLVKEKNLEVESLDGLNEMNFGLFDGYSLNEIRTKFPEDFNDFMNSDIDYRFPGGENLSEMYERNVESLKYIIDKCRNTDNVLICAHMGTIRNILAYLIADSKEAHWRFKVENASITEIDFLDGFPMMIQMGFIPYPEELFSPEPN